MAGAQGHECPALTMGSFKYQVMMVFDLVGYPTHTSHSCVDESMPALVYRYRYIFYSLLSLY